MPDVPDVPDVPEVPEVPVHGSTLDYGAYFSLPVSRAATSCGCRQWVVDASCDAPLSSTSQLDEALLQRRVLHGVQPFLERHQDE